jgi:hypothetical protein
MSTDEMPEATRKYFQEAKEDMIRKLNPCRFCAAKDEEFASLIEAVKRAYEMASRPNPSRKHLCRAIRECGDIVKERHNK